jgi:ribosomal-protein-alanine N-acetyltransferase
MPVILQTTRLIIQTFASADEDAYLALLTDPQVAVHLPKRGPDEIRKIFRDTIEQDAGGAYFSKWAIINKLDNDFVGMGLLRPFNDDPSEIEVGYALHQKYWGQGYATELTRALVAYAKNFPGTTFIVAVTTLGNTASQMVLQKAGLTKQENTVRHNEELAYFKMEVS